MDVVANTVPVSRFLTIVWGAMSLLFTTDLINLEINLIVLELHPGSLPGILD